MNKLYNHCCDQADEYIFCATPQSPRAYCSFPDVIRLGPLIKNYDCAFGSVEM